MIFEIFWRTKLAKKWRFFVQNTDNFRKSLLHNIGFREKKMAKIAENCDHNIDPLAWTVSQKIGPTGTVCTDIEQQISFSI
jgi:hypothetical protein